MAVITGPNTRPRIAADALEDFYRRAFGAAGYSDQDAATTARVLITADVRGIESHGAPPVRGYIQRTLRGLINPRPNITIVAEYPGTLVLDGDNGLGAVVGDYAMRQAVAKARTNGVATVTVRNSNHYASCFAYPLIAIEAGMAGMTMTTTGPTVLPTFGAAPLLGTNPICIGFPGGNTTEPFVIDMATSVVAAGKIGVYRREGKPLPAGWAYDTELRPTTDANAARHITTLGGDRDHSSQKGYGLNMSVDLFSALLSGGRYSAQMSGRQETPLGSAHMFSAWRIDAFVPMDEYRARFDEYITMLQGCPPMPGEERVLVPGQPEYEEEARRRAEGIPINQSIIDDLQATAIELEIPFV